MTGRGSSPVNGEPSDCEESTPLLPSVPSNQNGDDSPSSSASYFMSNLTTRQKWKSAWKIWRIPVMCYTFALLIEFGDFIRSTPRTRLLESIICNRYYAEQALNIGSGVGSPGGSYNHRLPIPEEQCKVPIVQAELLAPKNGPFSNGLALTFAIPFGYLANKTSRNFVLTLGVCAQIISELWTLFVCYFTPTVPFSLVYLTMFLKSTGGGQSVLTAMVYAILSDSVAAETRARAFLYLASAPLVIEMVAPVLGSVLMERWSVYVPLIVGFPFELCSLVMLRIIPISVKQGKQSSEERPLLDDSSSTEGDTDNENHDESEGANRKLKITILRILAPLIITRTLVCRSRNLLLVNLSFLVTTLGRETLDFLVQYSSKRFGWKLAKASANYLISFRAFVTLGLFLVILPIISRFFRKSRGMSPSKSDLWIARVSSIFGIIGPVMIGLSPSAELMIVALSLFTLSFGFRAAFQSYATSLVKPEEVALLYSALACMSIIGALIASPLIAATFRLGLSIGGLGIGLPFFVAAGFFTVSAIGAWGSRVEEDANN
ncbi:hypothetical protein HYFRA_00009706 [Hymenoscyphus fraxineus]|uniref:Major facilitator superfamily (MFS) profile domain-containing protein n=1 Tax=Hymenoscyphus fraxineus TaxID=746836 RepID=A0A9N9KR54_9HELO|nr:hypothetical protein HYFRA_00009706 [Hymenoscyphus fraxineus]